MSLIPPLSRLSPFLSLLVPFLAPSPFCFHVIHAYVHTYASMYICVCFLSL